MLVTLYRREVAALEVRWHGALDTPGTTTKGELLEDRPQDHEAQWDRFLMAAGAYSATTLARARGQLTTLYKKGSDHATPSDPRCAFDALAVAECILRHSADGEEPDRGGVHRQC